MPKYDVTILELACARLATVEGRRTKKLLRMAGSNV